MMLTRERRREIYEAWEHRNEFPPPPPMKYFSEKYGISYNTIRLIITRLNKEEARTPKEG